VLNFCKFTFSWGDYIAEVWDHWILEGNLLVLTIKDIPVGICHSFLTGPNEIWIEGIRVDKNFRKKRVCYNHDQRIRDFCKKK